MKSIVNKYVLFLLVLIFSCKNNTINKDRKTKLKNNELVESNYVDSLIGDFNSDNINDIVRIERLKDSTLLFKLYENNDKNPKITSNKILYKIGDLTSSNIEYITLSMQGRSIVISQEYGVVRPDGWFLTYINYKDGEFIVDSISNNFKYWKQSNDSIVIKTKSKRINKKISKVNLIKEFDMLE